MNNKKDKIIFDISPSPGASTCLANALEESKKIIEFLGKKYKFDESGKMSKIINENIKKKSVTLSINITERNKAKMNNPIK